MKKRVTLRMDLKLYEKIVQLAKLERRSIHAQILYMIEYFIKQDELETEIEKLNDLQR